MNCIETLFMPHWIGSLDWMTASEYCAVKRYNNCHFADDYNVVGSDYIGLVVLGAGLAFCGLGRDLEACDLVNITG